MRTSLCALLFAIAATGCAGQSSPSGDNPFLDDLEDSGKEDSAYTNPDGIEIEVDIEGDVTVGADWRLAEAPLLVAQYAMTYFRKQEVMYLESLAEDYQSRGRIEWLIDGAWLTADQVPEGAVRNRWRLRGVNAVLLHGAAEGVEEGKQFTARVPISPLSVFQDAGTTCADDDDHLALTQAEYWYRWLPDQESCTIPVQDLSVTVSKLFPTLQSEVYPEYDQLTADNLVTAVVMFGQIGDGMLTDWDPGMYAFNQYGTWLAEAGYAEVTAPLGKRYERTLDNGVTVQIDLYSPYVYAGLNDYARFANFEKGIAEHEIVVWDGHSALGASTAWSRPAYPSSYQIFLYGGCLGYEYYLKPIFQGKGNTWANLDIVSSVIEVSANANKFAAPAIAKIVWAIEHGGQSSWRDILVTIRDNVGDSTFGASGVRDNCYTPDGSRCQ
ncbi:MAG: hypothetical protein AB7O24_30765 [Kofleriaceae bacterium]